ncbi:MAG: hypothetical protein DMG35_19670 [Acidobacteria bacterium]|nr:MAG: hypothetical protein AUH86_01730 [Acidobacteria bacterium 13_1_40CM_4_58_4]PYT57755.1 MAG: hypothetical protein DMG35_19670 [Acidobacteriota bacterium]
MVCSSSPSDYLTLLERHWLVNVAAILSPLSLLLYGTAYALLMRRSFNKVGAVARSRKNRPGI